ncbi:MAG: hypothetical protein AB7T27_11510 [Kiritimatiellia bacterium]
MSQLPKNRTRIPHLPFGFNCNSRKRDAPENIKKHQKTAKKCPKTLKNGHFCLKNAKNGQFPIFLGKILNCGSNADDGDDVTGSALFDSIFVGKRCFKTR